MAPTARQEPLAVIPIHHASGHLVTLEATVCQTVRSSFIFDTGIGPTVISSSLASRIDAVPLGKDFKGKRMSGQELSLPLVILDSITAGGIDFRRAVAGIFDIFSDRSRIPPEFRDVEGFISPALFQDIPFTWEYQSSKIVLESDTTAETSRRSGRCVPMKVKKEGPSIQLMVDLKLPSGRVISAEIDTGSNSLILNRSLMSEPCQSKETRSENIEDETGHMAERVFSRLSGPVSLASEVGIAQLDPPVMFQDIVYDALIGVDFLKRFAVTFDIRRAEMIFNPP